MFIVTSKMLRRAFAFVIISALFLLTGVSVFAQPKAINTDLFGVYGTRWAEWVEHNHQLVGFYVYQIPIEAKLTDAQVVKDISATGVEVLAMQVIYPSFKERFQRKGMKADRKVQDVVNQIENNFSAPAFDEITVISLDEENFWWNGRTSYLTEIYNKLKPEVAGKELWQWFNDNQRQVSPVEDRFEVPADGYFTDMYSVSSSDYEARLLGYIKQKKPIVSTLWASPNWKHGERAAGRQTDWWDEEGWRSLYIKTLINRRYGVRTALFMYDLPYKGEGRELTPNFKSQDPCIRAFTEKLFNVTLPQLATIPINSVVPKNRPDWMSERCPTR